MRYHLDQQVLDPVLRKDGRRMKTSDPELRLERQKDLANRLRYEADRDNKFRYGVHANRLKAENVREMDSPE